MQFTPWRIEDACTYSKLNRIKQTENNQYYYGLEENQVAYKVEIDEQRKINESNKKHRSPTTPSNALRQKDNERGHRTGYLPKEPKTYTYQQNVHILYNFYKQLVIPGYPMKMFTLFANGLQKQVQKQKKD